MFERYLSDLVTAHFGHVVENLDAEKVRVSAWSGELVLRDLVLRKQALDNILGDQCAVEVAYGKVGHLELRLPWKLIRSQLWRGSSAASDTGRYGISVVLTDVNILLTPRRQSPFAEESDSLEKPSSLSEEEKRLRREEKVQDLLAAALLNRVTQSSHQGKPGAKRNRWQWLRDFASRLLSNLSVTVRNIHIRYEDPGFCMGFRWRTEHDLSDHSYRPGFAIGVTLHQFSIQTADPSTILGKSDFSRKQKERSPTDDIASLESLKKNKAEPSAKALHTVYHKIAAAYQLAIYWDSDTNLVSLSKQVNQERPEFDQGEEASVDYFALSFAALNDGSYPGFKHDNQAQHFFVLDHISPSLALSLVSSKSAQPLTSNKSVIEDVERDTIDCGPNVPPPPSELNLLLPPCHFSINGCMLEDIAYLRRSFSLWHQDKKGLLSDSSLRHLTSLRPTESVMDNPRSWWKYAFEATKVLNTESRRDKDSVRRHRGWLGVARLLSEKRRYISLYQRFLDAEQINHRAENHSKLFEMEDELSEEEIVAFRLAVYSKVSTQATSEMGDDLSIDESGRGKKMKPRTVALKRSLREGDDEGPRLGPESQHCLLTAEHRFRIFEEMTDAFDRNGTDGETTEVVDPMSTEKEARTTLMKPTKPDSIVWRALMQCDEFALQVNDRQTGFSPRSAFQSENPVWTPIVRLSFAWVQDQLIREDGSWEVNCVVASFTAADLTELPMQGSKVFPILIGHKSGEAQREEVIYINEMKHLRSLGVTIKRKRPPNEREDIATPTESEGSTTWTQVRVAPLQVVYATVPVEALSRVFASIKSPELADDFQRMKSVVFSWRERQKKRLLKALAHRQKKIFVDVDASAPLFLVPEDVTREDSPMVVIDLGQLRFHNSEVEPSVGLQSSLGLQKYDSKWQLSLSDIQVLCSLASVHVQSKLDGKSRIEDYLSWQHLVEPFSLNFSIETKTCQSDTDSTRVLATAVLPRLVFNLTTSAVRLVLRLKNQWAERKSEIEKNDTQQGGHFRSKPVTETFQDGAPLIVGLEFKLSAPVVAIRLENDVDSRDCLVLQEANHFTFLSRQHSTRIINLSLRGIEVRAVRDFSSTSNIVLLVEAKLHSLDAVDTYQAAGNDFSLLLSSRSPEQLAMSYPTELDLDWQSILDSNDPLLASQPSDTDLVSFEYYISSALSTNSSNVDIRFHELYVDWNPETIAAIQKAIRLPANVDAELESESQSIFPRVEETVDSDDEFFDAVEEVAIEYCSESESDMHLVSEISSTPSSSFSDAPECQEKEPLVKTSRSYMLNGFPLQKRLQPSIAFSPFLNRTAVSDAVDTEMSQSQKSEFLFSLTKLRVRFNKESRHRRLITAEMDETTVQFTSKTAGESKTSITIGNLVLIDSSGGPSSTLYGEILGLYTQFGQSTAKPSSLLNMEIEIHRKERRKGVVESSQVSDACADVTVDALHGKMSGSDYYITAHFSPMRFVFLEQLWFEIIDYFFEGIIGSSVWGARNISSSPDLKIEHYATSGSHLLGWNAEGVTFTRFKFVLLSPTVLVPVAYRSTHFIRLVTDTITVKNYFEGHVEHMTNAKGEETDWLQWFNHCVVELVSLRLISWNRLELTKGNNVTGARITVKWPTGPLARLIVPKWNVECRFDDLNLELRPHDCALLQHIVSHNIGETSRHIDEWHALQSLPPDDLLRYREQIMVHFGYDKKDVTPSTFKVIVILPSVRCLFVTENGKEQTVAQAWCSRFSWSLVKLPDCISRQKITCDIDLIDPCGDGEPVRMIAPAKSQVGDSYELTYNSVSRLSGDNTKSLQISDACIYLVYPSWMKFLKFFQDFPAPVILTKADVSLSIQVGDHWYRIDGGTPRCSVNEEELNGNNASASWKEHALPKQIDRRPTYQFRLLLIAPSIVMPSTATNRKSVVLRVERLDFFNKDEGSLQMVSRYVCLHGLEMYTREQLQGEKLSNEYSLIHPWSLVGCVVRCSDAVSSNSVQIKSDVLRARAAFSDMTVVLEVVLSLLADVRAFEQLETVSTCECTSTFETSERVINQSGIRNTIYIDSAGFELLVVDDSKRHFADDQELIILRVGNVLVIREDLTKGGVTTASKQVDSQELSTESLQSALHDCYTVKIRLHSFDILDCLQSAFSPFRVVATNRSGLLDNSDSILRWYESSQWTNEYDGSIEPQVSWFQYFSYDDDEWGFRCGDAFKGLLTKIGSWARMEGALQDLITLDVRVHSGTMTSYEFKLHSIAMQWNPSTVIALQRFLGRLLKEARTEALKIIGNHRGFRKDRLADETTESVVPSDESSTSVRFSIDTVTVCLNKEHQNRRLLQLSLSECLVAADHGQTGFCVTCEVGNLTVVDTDRYDVRRGGPQMLAYNRFVLRMARPQERILEKSKQGFLHLRYVSYKGGSKSPQGFASDVPPWVRSKVFSAHGSLTTSSASLIDDFLIVSIARLQFSFIRERTEEIVDYLSNGLPGKGMGATTRAAQGFLKERIQTKSFLELNVEAPDIVVPEDESASRGLILRLGNVKVRSWFEESSLVGPVTDRVGTDEQQGAIAIDENMEWWRMLSLSLSGLCGGSWKLDSHSPETAFSVCSKPIDLGVALQKPTWKGKTSTVQGNLSFVDLTLSYSDYLLLHSILRNNVGRRIEKDRWDNVEKSFWMEQQNDFDTGIGIDVASSLLRPGINALTGSFKHVTYSSSARFVRYGRRQSGPPKGVLPEGNRSVGMELDIKFELSGLSIKLQRDDLMDGMRDLTPVPEMNALYSYDLILLTVQVVELSYNANSAGDKSFHLSLFTLGLFDLGERGRLARESYLNSLYNEKTLVIPSRLPCAFKVIAEGYSSSAKNSHLERDILDPQILVTVDTCAASSIGEVGCISNASGLSLPERVTMARIVINFLTVNALIRPLKEVVAFLSCAWASADDLPQVACDYSEVCATPYAKALEPSPSPPKNSNFQLKLVAHYPRIFFVADESDVHSRALVLTGLAVVNAGFLSHTTSQSNTLVELPLARNITTVDAQLHRLESYINPDVSNVLGLQQRHVKVLASTISAVPLSVSDDDFVDVGEHDNVLGVALIQPVTVGVEFSRDKRTFFPTTRFVAVNMEPVSTMLSFEDMQLIEIVLRRWSARRNRAEAPTVSASIDTVFHERTEQDKVRAQKVAAFGNSKPSQVTFEAVFHSRRLALGLRKETYGVVVDQVLDSEHSARIRVGDILVSVNGFNVLTKSLSDVVQLLSNTPRPTTLKFCRRESGLSNPKLLLERSRGVSNRSENETNSSNISQSMESSGTDPDQQVDGKEHFSIILRCGIRNGLVLERSSCGNIPIVSGIEQNSLAESIFFAEGGNRRIPFVGAGVVKVNDKSSSELGFEETLSYIEDLCLNVIERSEGGYGESQTSTYSLTFVEMQSGAWGTLDKIDISLSRVVLTFIDDLKGRDMPLFRGKLGPVFIRLEKGKGLETSIVGGNPLKELLVEPTGKSSLHNAVKLSAMTRASVEYFHPKIANWEPLLEPSQLCLLLEQRAGYVAIEISDHLHDSDRPGSLQLPTSDIMPQLVCLNLSDAAAEVISQTLREWTEWRRSSNIASPDEEMLLDQQDRSKPGKLYLSHGDTTQNLSKLEMTESLPGVVVTSSSERKAIKDTYTEEDQMLMKYRIAKKSASQKAAQAALLFAQKRGAGTHEKGEPAKPFVFRNRTGVSVAFAQQSAMLKGHRSANREFGAKTGAVRHLSVVGEYVGLEDYDSAVVTELADGQEAKFTMDADFDGTNNDVDVNYTDWNAKTATKVRTYEGRFPRLTVAIQAVSGVTVEALTDLPVIKVGCSVRQLRVRKELPDTHRSFEYTIPVLWEVEIEDNRRILTLASAVRVDCLAFGTSIEVGVTTVSFPASNDDIQSAVQIKTVGFARLGSPFYLPLLIALNLEVVHVHIRPNIGDTASFRWGKQSVLEFSTRQKNIFDSEDLGHLRVGRTAGEWKETFCDSTMIECSGTLEHPLGESHSAWLSCIASKRRESLKGKPAPLPRLSNQASMQSILSISIDSGLTIRNLLPMKVEWEVAYQRKNSAPKVVDSSSFRHHLEDERFFPRLEPRTEQICSLPSGDCVEVFACEFGATEVVARFKCDRTPCWSNWATISCQGSENDHEFHGSETKREEEALAALCSARQVNVQIRNDFGVPLTIGVRNVPKGAKSLFEGNAGTGYYGVEMIVYAELWFWNLTSLPLNIGCPARQLIGVLNSADINSKENAYDVNAAKFTAEAALMEMASVLELGEKGTGLTGRYGNPTSKPFGTRSLPLQESNFLVEEVFEYLEIEKSSVKRRWWASEIYDDLRPNLTEVEDNGQNWRWIDECWNIDCLGAQSAANGGWESCRSLVGEKENVFSVQREFNPSHNFRRRRWFRRRETREPGLCCGIQAFHQPIPDAFTVAQKQASKKRVGGSSGNGSSRSTDMSVDMEDANLRICVNVGGGWWSDSAVIPLSGSAHGVLRVGASRWPTLTQLTHRKSRNDSSANNFVVNDGPQSSRRSKHCYPDLSPKLFELCYHVSDLEGDWGEFSRLMVVSPRFFVRNDSAGLTMDVKQTGAADETMLRLIPGEASAFHWADCRLPDLVSVRPSLGDDPPMFRWSGGFDICSLGMTAVRVRRAQLTPRPPYSQTLQAGHPFECLRSVRATVEIRRGTGGFGITISLQEEDPSGDGSLFRIENHSTFPVWLAQDGVLANPSTSLEPHGAVLVQYSDKPPAPLGLTDDHSQVDGELILPGDKMCFALDVPFRQGKYAGRQAATISELLRVRVALAPLSSRPGIETTKMVEFSEVGNCVRMNPSKLTSILDGDLRSFLTRVRVLCVVTTDGPTRVLKLCLMEKEAPDSVFGNPFGDTSVYSSAYPNPPDRHGSPDDRSSSHKSETLNAAVETARLLERERLPNEDDAVRNMVFGKCGKNNEGGQTPPSDRQDVVFSIRAEFSGFVFSLVDSSPAEIAVASLKNVNALSRWNALRTSDASAIISVGWIQVDNHVPNAPFPVAIFPIERPENERDDDPLAAVRPEKRTDGPAPLLVIGLTFAPKHKSGMVCLRSVTIAPRNIGIAIDLAFLVRLQRYIGGIQAHMKGQRHHASEGSRQNGAPSLASDQKKVMTFPNVEGFVQSLQNAVEVGVTNQKFYFGGLSILPCNIKLSVAPARALTPAQAALEGAEAAAIHEAVRKGDVLLGGRTALLGVKVGRKNTTALAVVRGVMKSIIVDALLRLDGASLSFSGFAIRNHITTGSQLRTYLAAHYLASLRTNVPALLGSLAALGNPLGLIRGLGDGVSDFVTEPVKGLKKSVKELDPFFLVDGVARGTESLARHAVGGFADSASLLTETFSKNMAVLTLDRRYAQKRDREKTLRGQQGDVGITFAEGMESGMMKLVQGFFEGVTGVVKAPLRGAEKKGFEGFAKGIGKGLLGLLVKPMIGISDAATDVMIGVKGSVESGGGFNRSAFQPTQVRPRRPMYGRDRVLRAYELDDAAACSLMTRTRLAGENYLSHFDMLDRVALLSVKRLLLLGSNGEEQLLLKLKHVASVEVRPIDQEDGTSGWGIIVKLSTPRSNGSEIEVITCSSEEEATELCCQIQRGANLVANETL